MILGASTSRIRDPGSNRTESDNDGADEDDDTGHNESSSETDSEDDKPLRRPTSMTSKNSLNRLDRDRGRKRSRKRSEDLERNDRRKTRRKRSNRSENRKLRKRTKEINFAEIDKKDDSTDSDESYVCTNCKKKRYDCNWVQCSSCKIWFCAKCVPNVKRYMHDIELVFNCAKCSTNKNSIKQTEKFKSNFKQKSR